MAKRFFALNAPPPECLCCNHVCRQRSNSGEQACSGIPYPRISPHFPPVFPRFPPFSPVFPHFPSFFPISPIFPIFPWPKKDLETPGWETSKVWNPPPKDRRGLGHALSYEELLSALLFRPFLLPPVCLPLSGISPFTRGCAQQRVEEPHSVSGYRVRLPKERSLEQP